MLEKQNLEVTVLREFFREQWTHVLHLIQDRQKRNDEISAHNQHLTDAVEHIVDKVDSRIRGTRNYHLRLCRSAHELLNYIQELIAQLPEPISIGRDSYLSDPLINAMFNSSSDLKRLIVKSMENREISDAQKSEDKQELHALLFVHKEDKQILGKKISGDILQRDVPQTAVTFYGHQITTPTDNEVMARSSLEIHIFESIVLAVRSKMVRLRHNQIMQEGKQVTLNPELNMNNPETYLRVLTEELSIPKNIVTLKSNAIKISKMGILLPAGSRESSNKLTLHELVIIGSRTHSVTPIRFKRSEW